MEQIYPYTVKIADTVEGLMEQLKELQRREPDLMWFSGAGLLNKSKDFYKESITENRFLKVSLKKSSDGKTLIKTGEPINLVDLSIPTDIPIQLYPL